MTGKQTGKEEKSRDISKERGVEEGEAGEFNHIEEHKAKTKE